MDHLVTMLLVQFVHLRLLIHAQLVVLALLLQLALIFRLAQVRLPHLAVHLVHPVDHLVVEDAQLDGLLPVALQPHILVLRLLVVIRHIPVV